MKSMQQFRCEVVISCERWLSRALLPFCLHQPKLLKRRLLAALLLALFGFSFVSPLVLASDSDSKLPACCRRLGKHHCAVLETSSSSGPVFRATPCSVFPGAQIVPARIGAAINQFRASVLPLNFSPQAIMRHDNGACSAPFSGSHQKRGPPSLLS
jgi:hypothetical protein